MSYAYLSGKLIGVGDYDADLRAYQNLQAAWQANENAATAFERWDEQRRAYERYYAEQQAYDAALAKLGQYNQALARARGGYGARMSQAQYGSAMIAKQIGKALPAGYRGCLLQQQIDAAKAACKERMTIQGLGQFVAFPMPGWDVCDMARLPACGPTPEQEVGPAPKLPPKPQVVNHPGPAPARVQRYAAPVAPPLPPPPALPPVAPPPPPVIVVQAPPTYETAATAASPLPERSWQITPTPQFESPPLVVVADPAPPPPPAPAAAGMSTGGMLLLLAAAGAGVGAYFYFKK